MEHESLNEMQPYLPTLDPGLVDVAEAAETLERPAGRFRLTLPFIERITINLVRVAQNLACAMMGRPAVFLSGRYPVPLNWRRLFRYLFEEKIIASPQVSLLDMLHDEPKFYSVSVPAAMTDADTDGLIVQTAFGGGASLNFEEALSKAIGEHLERLALARYRKKNLHRASIGELEARREKFLDPRALASFSEDQIKKRGLGFENDRQFFWVRGEELTCGKALWIPAQLVFWNYRHDESFREPFLREPNTNGAGGHFTREEAILSGICEAIERDAFVIRWLTMLPPPRVAPESIPNPALQELLRSLQRYRLEAVLLNTTLDMPVPSAVCILLDHSGKGPKLTMGGGCGFRFDEALYSGVIEALRSRYLCRTRWPSFSLPSPYRPFEDASVTQKARIALWGGEEMYPNIEPFLSGKPETFDERSAHYPEMRSPAEALASLIAFFRSRAQEIYVYDASLPVLKKLGYFVMKVISPQLVPLYLNEINAPLGAARLKEVPSALGLIASQEMNRWPHPFP